MRPSRLSVVLLVVALATGCSDDGDGDGDGAAGSSTTTSTVPGATTTSTAPTGQTTTTAPASRAALAALSRVDCDALLTAEEAAAINEVAVASQPTNLPEAQTISCVYRAEPVLRSFTVAVAPATGPFESNRSRFVSAVEGLGDEAYIAEGPRSQNLFVRVGDLAFVTDIRSGDDNQGAGTFSIDRATAVAELVIPRLRAIQ